MPIYEYECQCGNIQDEIHGMNESPKIKCSKCGSTKMRKLISAGSFIIKADSSGPKRNYNKRR